MTDTTFIPDYLKPALERLAAAREAHLEQARRMEDTLTAITLSLIHICLLRASANETIG